MNYRFMTIVMSVLVLVSSAAAQVPDAQRVFVVVEHGHAYESIVNSGSMPYLNKLAAENGLATEYYANTHPSIGNLFTMTTGQAITNDDTFTGILKQDNIVRHLLQAGKTWKSYAESLPYAGYTGGDKYPYLKRQNPFAYFADVANSSERQNLVPFTQFAADMQAGTLPDLSFIVPNANNSMRDCPAGMSSCSDAQRQAAADQWLSTNIAPLLATETFKNNGLLVIVFDESVASDTTNGGGHVAAIMVGPRVKSGYKSGARYDHRNLLTTVLRALGVGTSPAKVAKFAAMGDFFKAASTGEPGTTEPTTPPVSEPVAPAPTEPVESTSPSLTPTATTTSTTCRTSTATMQSQGLSSPQSGTFRFEFDATPTMKGDMLTGLSSNATSSYVDMAVLFNAAGGIQARNGSALTTSTTSYAVGTSYHFRFEANVASRTYSVYVTPQGSTERAVGTNLAFRTGTTGTSITSLVYIAYSGSHSVCNPKLTLPTTSTPTPSAPAPTAYDRYVGPTGVDAAGYGSSPSTPWRTIQYAVNQAQPGWRINVAPGTYQERVNITKSGTATARIVLKSTTKWGAKVTTTSSQGYYHIGINANYVDVVGFDVYGTSTSTAGIGIDIFGSYNRVIGNRVHDLITSDCSGRGGLVGITVPWTGQTVATRKYNEITGNVVHDIHCTTFPGNKAGACIYIADQHNTVNNNLVYTCGSYGIESNHLTGWNKIINNTVANVPNGYGSAGIMMSAGGDSTYTVVSDYNIVANNIVIDSNQGIAAYFGMNGSLGRNNVWSNNLTWNNKANTTCKSGGYCPPDTNGLHVNPMFVYKSYSGISGNFKLQSSSPAVNKATTTYAPTFDMEGASRPLGAGPDIGSYESY
ncbi:MAG TPA: alkaline phosphatase family protein [Terriglobales bacterium]|nr:alkaline phosphatase family protein [Terriglobales bacterium]